MTYHSNVLIIGAGISGVGIALHLTKGLPDKTYTILEGRSDLGGTWDLFRYPGIRSDSDMLTFSYKDRPWVDDRILSPGSEIKRYIDETASEFGIKEHIRFNTRVKKASYDSASRIWTIFAESNGESLVYTANFIVGSTGYYDYEQGFQPNFPGEKLFKGDIIHPQFWPEKIDYVGKKFVVIGSGATAVTLVPNLAKRGAHATMLQRTPTWLTYLPLVDWFYTKFLRRLLPTKSAYTVARWRLILRQWLAYHFSQAFPRLAAWYMLFEIKRRLASRIDANIHFNPPYKPWDQRVCVVPEDDLFKCLNRGECEIVTEKIRTFDETGILTESGRHLDADYIVTATGLKLKFLGGIEFEIDGKPAQDIANSMVYRGILMSHFPNMAVVVGYTNNSWTLKVDLCGQYIVKLLKEMDRRNASEVRVDTSNVAPSADPIMSELKSAYLWRAAEILPKQGDKPEFVLNSNYLWDRWSLLGTSFDDGYIIIQ